MNEKYLEIVYECIKAYILLIPVFLWINVIVVSVATFMSKTIRVRGPIYKGYIKFVDKKSNPHWYCNSTYKSYLLRIIQLINYMFSVLSPAENMKVYFCDEIIEEEYDILYRPIVKIRYVASAFGTELVTLHNLLYVTVTAIFYDCLPSELQLLAVIYIIFDLVVLFDRISYKSFLKFIYHADRKVHNIGRSVVLLIFNYIHIITCYTVIYQSDLVIFNIKRKFLLIDYLYFSIITITTLGYGDLSPVNISGKAIVVTESLWGVWILVIAVSRFIGAIKKPLENTEII